MSEAVRRWIGSADMHIRTVTQMADRTSALAVLIGEYNQIKEELEIEERSATMASLMAEKVLRKKLEEKMEQITLAKKRLQNITAIYDSKMVAYEDGGDVEWKPYKD